MYKRYPIQDLIKTAEAVLEMPLEYMHPGILVYVGCNPDDVSPDFVVDSRDTEGIKIFRKFAAEFAAHLKTLKIIS